jgi:hypothetical protein
LSIDTVTTTELLEFVISLFSKKLSREFTVIGVESGNPDLDYYLACLNRPLSVIRKPITLSPLIQ